MFHRHDWGKWGDTASEVVSTTYRSGETIDIVADKQRRSCNGTTTTT